MVRSQPNVTSWETAPLTPLPCSLLTVPPTLTHAGSKQTPVLFVSLLTRPPLPLEPELFHGESAWVLLTAGAPSPEIARDVTECHPGPHRGVSSGAACLGSAHLPRPGGGPWRSGLAFLCLLKFFPAGGPSCCSQASTFKPVWISALGPPQPTSTPWGLQPQERVLPQFRRPESEIQAGQGRAPSRGSGGGSLLPLPAPGGPSVPRLGAASLSITLSSLGLLSSKDTCPWI